MLKHLKSGHSTRVHPNQDIFFSKRSTAISIKHIILPIPSIASKGQLGACTSYNWTHLQLQRLAVCASMCVEHSEGSAYLNGVTQGGTRAVHL